MAAGYSGANERSRTADLFITNEVLCLLSYVSALPRQREYYTAKNIFCQYVFIKFSKKISSNLFGARVCKYRLVYTGRYRCLYAFAAERVHRVADAPKLAHGAERPEGYAHSSFVLAADRPVGKGCAMVAGSYSYLVSIV